MIRIEKICIDLMLLLKSGKCTKKNLHEYKENIFKTAVKAACGEKVWKKIIRILDK